MDYSSLKDEIGRWVNRPEIEPAIDTFIELAEAHMNRRLSEAGVSGGMKLATSTVASDFAAAPADLARLEQMTFTDDGTQLTQATAAGFEALKALEPDRTGRPQIVTLSGAGLRYYPAPDTAYGVELSYQSRPPALSDASPTNWVIEAHPDVYLYGVLVRAAEYLGGDERLAIWRDLYEDAIGSAVAAERNRRGAQSAGAYRTDLPYGLGRPFRFQVCRDLNHPRGASWPTILRTMPKTP